MQIPNKKLVTKEDIDKLFQSTQSPLDDKYIYPSFSAFANYVINIIASLNVPLDKVSYLYDVNMINNIKNLYITLIELFSPSQISLAILDSYYWGVSRGIYIYWDSTARRGGKTGNGKCNISGLCSLTFDISFKICYAVMRKNPDLNTTKENVLSILLDRGIIVTTKGESYYTSNNMRIDFFTGGSPLGIGRGNQYDLVILDEGSRYKNIVFNLEKDLATAIAQTQGIILIPTTPNQKDGGSFMAYARESTSKMRVYIKPTWFNNFNNLPRLLAVLRTQDEESRKVEWQGIPLDNNEKIVYEEKYFGDMDKIALYHSTHNDEYGASVHRARKNQICSTIAIDPAETVNKRSDYTGMVHLSMGFDEQLGNIYFFVKDYLREKLSPSDFTTGMSKFIYKNIYNWTNPKYLPQSNTLRSVCIDITRGYGMQHTHISDLSPMDWSAFQHTVSDPEKNKYETVEIIPLKISGGGTIDTLYDLFLKYESEENTVKVLIGSKGDVASNSAMILSYVYNVNRTRFNASLQAATPVVIWDCDPINTYTNKVRTDFKVVKKEIFGFTSNKSHEGTLNDDVTDALTYCIRELSDKMSMFKTTSVYKNSLLSFEKNMLL